jgi:hypothetical protein
MREWCAEYSKVANARVAGMEEDLRLDVGSRYTTALLVFFIAHIFFGVRVQPYQPRYTHIADMSFSVALKHPSLQNRHCELAGVHCFRLGDSNAGPGTDSPKERVTLPNTLRYSRCNLRRDS